MVAYAMAIFMKERMMKTSDIAKFRICDDCDLFAAKVIDKEYYECKSCRIPLEYQLLYYDKLSLS